MNPATLIDVRDPAIVITIESFFHRQRHAALKSVLTELKAVRLHKAFL